MEDPKGDTMVDGGAWSNTRRYIRLKPDTSTYAGIDTRTEDQSFIPEFMGLVFEESSHGCGMIFIGTEKLRVGDICRIQIGTREPVEAELRWRKEIDRDVIRTGFLYLNEEEKAG
jgi:hypothetical protein